jgi:hypothetical protein
VTKAKEEIAKATERGLELSAAEVKLEEAREKVHAKSASNAERKAFKAAQEKVRAQRVEERMAREAAGPPTPANPGDAVVRPGGAS